MTSMITIRASSLSTLFDCAHRWEGEHLLGMRKASSAPAQLGTAVHAGTAAFDQSRIDKSGLTVDDCAAAVVDAIYHPEEDVDWSDMKPKDAEKTALLLHTKYCTEVSPAIEFAAVELKCDRLEVVDLNIALTGTTDRIYLDGKKRGIADLKTGKKAVEANGKAATKYHREQLGVYELLAEFADGHKMDAPAMIIGLKTQGKAVVGTGTVRGARDYLVGTDGEPGLLEAAAKIVHSGDFHGNPRSFLCSAKYCARYSTCKYKGL